MNSLARWTPLAIGPGSPQLITEGKEGKKERRDIKRTGDSVRVGMQHNRLQWLYCRQQPHAGMRCVFLQSCLQLSALTTRCLGLVFRTGLPNSFSRLDFLPSTSPPALRSALPPARPLAGFVELNALKSQTQQASPLLCAAPAQQRAVRLINNLCTFPQYLNSLLLFFFLLCTNKKKRRHIYKMLGADTICRKTCSFFFCFFF